MEITKEAAKSHVVSHADRFRLRALLAAVFRKDPNFGLQCALDPRHGAIPLNHSSFDGIVRFLKGIAAVPALERAPQ